MKSVSINSISQLHDYLQLPRPSHPLISVYPHNALQGKIKSGVQYTFGLYQVSLKDGLQCVMGYGRSHYDFDDGSMVFMSPGQSASVDNVQSNTSTKGWTIAFHPDFIKQGVLGKNINQYHFFEYACNESLHLSEKECQVVTDISKEIEYELSQSMDRHTQTLLQSRLALLFNYCVRFYDRQFYVRADLNQSYVDRFEQLLIDYYRSDKPLEQGIPSVQYCGKALALSPYYLSDLLKRETGKSALEYIHLFLIDRAKTLISEYTLSITQISYELGFEYPQHFSKLFKAKTGMNPSAYRGTGSSTKPNYIN